MAQVAVLSRQVAELAAKLGQNSRNSHLPPSSDPPGSAGKTGSGKPRSKSERKRGGQLGHRGSRRELVPEARVNDSIDFYPAECENCWAALPEVADPDAKRYQVIEVPPIQPHTSEYRRHAVRCACCGHKTRAAYDEDAIPASPFGPRPPDSGTAPRRTAQQGPPRPRWLAGAPYAVAIDSRPTCPRVPAVDHARSAALPRRPATPPMPPRCASTRCASAPDARSAPPIRCSSSCQRCRTARSPAQHHP